MWDVIEAKNGFIIDSRSYYVEPYYSLIIEGICIANKECCKFIIQILSEEKWYLTNKY